MLHFTKKELDLLREMIEEHAILREARLGGAEEPLGEWISQDRLLLLEKIDQHIDSFNGCEHCVFEESAGMASLVPHSCNEFIEVRAADEIEWLSRRLEDTEAELAMARCATLERPSELLGPDDEYVVRNWPHAGAVDEALVRVCDELTRLRARVAELEDIECAIERVRAAGFVVCTQSRHDQLTAIERGKHNK